MSDLLVLTLALMALLNLVLTVGVVRRLHAHEDKLFALAGGAEIGSARPRLGERLPDFEVAHGGVVASSSGFGRGSGVIGLFTTNCAPCLELYPDFLAHLAEHNYDRVLVVLGAPKEQEAREMARQAEGLAEVIVLTAIGTIASPLGVDRFPTIIRTLDGQVHANVSSLGGLKAALSAGPSAGAA